MKQPPWVQPSLLVISVGLMVLSFGLFVTQSLPVLTFGYSINYGEGVLLDQVRRVFDAPGLYPSFEAPPYVIDNYPPVYPVLASLIPCPEGAPFFGGRLISIISTLVSMAVIGLFVRRHAGDAAGLLCASAFLLTPEVQRFAVLMRVDSLGLALGLVGLLAVTSGSARGRWIGCVAFFFSVYTRHSMLALPLVGFTFLFVELGWRRALPWAAGLLGAGILAFLLGDLYWGGRFHEHLISFNVLNYDWGSTEGKWLVGQWPWRLGLIAAGLMAVYPWSTRGLGISGTQILYWVCVLFAVAMLGRFVYDCYQQEPSERQEELRWDELGGANAGRRTSFESLVRADTKEMERLRKLPYTSEVAEDLARLARTIDRNRRLSQGLPRLRHLFYLYLGVAMAGAVAIFHGIRPGPGQRRDALLAGQGAMLILGTASATMIGRAGSDTNYLLELFALFILAAGLGLRRGDEIWRKGIAVFLVTFWIVGFEGLSHRDSRPERLEARAAISAGVLAQLEDIEGDILSEDPSYAPLLGRPLLYQPFMYRQLSNAEVWDPTPLMEAIRRQSIPVVVREAVQPYAGFENGKPYFGQMTWNRTSSFPRPVHDLLVDRYELRDSSRRLEKITPLLYRIQALWVPEQDKPEETLTRNSLPRASLAACMPDGRPAGRSKVWPSLRPIQDRVFSRFADRPRVPARP